MIIRKQIGLTRQNSVQQLKNDDSLKHLKNILIILNDLPDFKAIHVSSLLIKLLKKQETKRIGAEIIDGFAQKTMARLVRNFLSGINQSK